MHKITLTLSTLFILLFTTGCTPITPKYKVAVDAIAAPNFVVRPTTYSIKALGEKTDASSLNFQQQIAHLKSILNQKGYSLTNYPSLAEQVIYFDYGIEKVSEEHRYYNHPNITFGLSWGYPYGYYGRRYYHPFYHDFWYGGYTRYHKASIHYNRYITLLAKEQTGKELWRVDVSSIGESKNLKKIVPILLQAAQPYMGTNTQETVKLVIKENVDKKE